MITVNLSNQAAKTDELWVEVKSVFDMLCHCQLRIPHYQRPYKWQQRWAHVYSTMIPLAEQRAVARTLSDMDAEAGRLEAQLAKYRRVKEGMMQELLTGKKRLV